MSGFFCSLLLLTTVVAEKGVDVTKESSIFVATMTTPVPEDTVITTTKDSPNMSVDQFLSTTNCTLTISNDSLSKLELLMTLSPALIYMKLNFIDLEFESETAYLNETPNILDPFTWIWASKGKGYLLRGFYDNYLVASFGILRSDVHDTSIQVNTTKCSNFMNVSDSAKLVTLANLLTLYGNRACTSSNEKGETCKDYQVCQSFISDRFLDVTVLFYSLHYVLLRSTYNKCWSVTNNELVETIQEKIIIDNAFYLTVNTLTQILVLMYFPLIILEVIEPEKAPIRISNTQVWIGPNNDLPVGFKYWLFSWNGGKDGSRIVSSLRFLLTFLFINLVIFLDLILMQFTDDTYHVKRASVFRYMDYTIQQEEKVQ
ncbi:uncharacterized protein [Amphiura filiformis]|uniref:uncharacterized protein n=1 Tax=Amphiura filiformis TaxID=82378 RepID=UPI003B210A0D